jgi:hypothetical protein
MYIQVAGDTLCLLFANRSFRDGDLEATAGVWLESWQSTGFEADALATKLGFQERFRLELEAGWHIAVAAEAQRGLCLVGRPHATTILPVEENHAQV